MKTQEPFRIIAIDGPAGAGKSTVAKEVARNLGYFYLDTGALYRATALHFLRSDVALDEDSSQAEALSKLDLKLDPEGRVFLGSEDVSQEIRSREVAGHVSSVAALPVVRQKLVAYQQDLGRGKGISPRPPGLVAEGRDIGTVVFPQADVKFFLVADLRQRAIRRQKEFVRDGQPLPLETVMEEIARRDEKDSRRKHSPLKKAEGAIEVDTTGLSIEETLGQVLEAIRKSGA